MPACSAALNEVVPAPQPAGGDPPAALSPLLSRPVPALGDLDAYLTRIGLSVPPTPVEMHRAHATSIPFENFDPYSGHQVSLDLARIEEKMVARGRGGYCFEHNLLFMAALASIGIDDVAPMLARTRRRGEAPRPLNHLLLRVMDQGRAWLADVGFGGGGLLDPIPFEAGVESDQAGWRYRIVEDGNELVLQVFQDGAWTDMFGFVPLPAALVDIEVSNWFTATHPESPFVTAVVAGARRVDRCLTLFVQDGAVLIERQVGQASSTTEVSREEVPALLADRFGIAGVAWGANGRLRIEEARG